MTVPKKPIEVEAAHDGNGNVVVVVSELKFEVLPRGKWRISAIEALREGRYTDWAKGAMTEESYDTWIDADPTQEEVEELFKGWAEATGQSRDLSRAQRRVSQNSRRK